jgi:probable F420-dependent oxidoreductase
MRTYADGLPTITIRVQNYAQVPQDWSRLVRRARLADEAGVDRLLVADHVLLSEHLDAYEGGTFPTGPEAPWLEPMTTLSVIAGATQNIRLATSIIMAPLRRPIVLAKAAATLDVLSGGRFELGVGVGWHKQEYAAAGLDFHERGRLLDETLELCRRFWTESPVDYRSDRLTVERMWCEPKPLQEGGVPIWVAGRLNKRVLERVVRYGDGWIPWMGWRDNATRGVEVIREAFRDAGREWDGFEVCDGLHLLQRADGTVDLDATLADVPERAAAGVTDFVAPPGFPGDDDVALAQLPALVEAFRATVGRA